MQWFCSNVHRGTNGFVFIWIMNEAIRHLHMHICTVSTWNCPGCVWGCFHNWRCFCNISFFFTEIKALQNRLPQQCVRALVGCRSHSRSEPSVRPLLSNSPVSWISLSRLLDECVLSVHQLSSSAPLSLVLFVFGLRQKNVPETFWWFNYPHFYLQSRLNIIPIHMFFYSLLRVHV